MFEGKHDEKGTRKNRIVAMTKLLGCPLLVSFVLFVVFFCQRGNKTLALIQN